MKNKYTNTPDGISGNDDYGTMSAWFVWASIGIYPLSGSTTYMLGSPLFDSISIKLPSGTLDIITYGNTDSNVYVQKVAVNGTPLTEPFVDHSQIMPTNGGTVQVEFWITSTPET